MSDKQDVISALNVLLASSYTLFLKTHNYHWNVTGPMFTTLHTLFETQYNEYFAAVDEIAERIRALGAFAPGSYAEFSTISTITDDSERRSAIEMINILAADQETVVAAAQAVVSAAEAVGDIVSADLGTRRSDVHQKNAWMLRSHLDT